MSTMINTKGQEEYLHTEPLSIYLSLFLDIFQITSTNSLEDVIEKMSSPEDSRIVPSRLYPSMGFSFPVGSFSDTPSGLASSNRRNLTSYSMETPPKKCKTQPSCCFRHRDWNNTQKSESSFASEEHPHGPSRNQGQVPCSLGITNLH